MRMPALAAAIALTVVATPTIAPAQPAAPSLAPALETCIRANVAAVEAAVPSLQEGVIFLADQLCAAEVAAAFQASLVAENERMMTIMRAQCTAHREGGGASALFDGSNPCDMLRMQEESAVLYPPTMGMTSASPAPVEATALAARLLLEARLARR